MFSLCSDKTLGAQSCLDPQCWTEAQAQAVLGFSVDVPWSSKVNERSFPVLRLL